MVWCRDFFFFFYKDLSWLKVNEGYIKINLNEKNISVFYFMKNTNVLSRYINIIFEYKG